MDLVAIDNCGQMGKKHLICTTKSSQSEAKEHHYQHYNQKYRPYHYVHKQCCKKEKKFTTGEVTANPIKKLGENYGKRGRDLEER